MVSASPPSLHRDVPLFREAINFTAARTGFPPLLIEKDYFCTVLLMYLAGSDCSNLVFKGGTCLAKVHAGFYRLSEDLDFSIPLAVNSGRAQRRAAIASAKECLSCLVDGLGEFAVVKPLAGFNFNNNCRQYVGSIGYVSSVTGQSGSIQLEVSLREPLLRPVVAGTARTLLQDPVSGTEMLDGFSLPCISLEEALAEKLRAALSRREAAIRDFYDIYHAAELKKLDLTDEPLVALVRRKLAVPGNPPVDLSPERLLLLSKQVNTRLRPVLRNNDFQAFNFERALDVVTAVANGLG